MKTRAVPVVGIMFLALLAVSSADMVFAQVFSEFKVPTDMSGVARIATGPDGALWFTENTSGKIGTITTSGLIVESLIGAASGPDGIAAGPDGALWFCEGAVNKIGRITTQGDLTEFPLASGTVPVDIAAGPDGALWFTESGAEGGKIGRIDTDGTISEFPVPTRDGSSPEGIAAGPDGALWFTENIGGRIGRITTDGAITEFPVTTTGTRFSRIAAGPDGALWFTEIGANKIGRSTTAGVITEFPVPTAFSLPDGIAAGADGALWFTEQFGNKIGRITTAGVITEFPIPTPGGTPIGIAAGPDGALWFTEINGNKIGRLTTPAGSPVLAVSKSAAASVVSGQNLTYTLTYGNTGSGNATGALISDALPAGTDFISATGGGTFASGVVTWNVGSLNAGVTGQRVSFTVKVTAASGTIINSVYAIRSSEVSAVTGPLVSTSVTTAPSPTLTISKTAAASVVSGQNLTYTLNYGNTGSGGATGVLISDAVPAGTAFVSATGGGTFASGVVTWAIGGLNAGVTGQTVSFTVVVSAASGSIFNAAYSIQANGVPAISGAAVSTTVIPPPSVSVVAVVASIPGAPPSLFKTGFQMYNPTDSVLAGRLVFHPQGVVGSAADPSLDFSLAARATQSFGDLLPAMGLTGPRIGSLDVVMPGGVQAPVVAARIFNDAGAAGTTGFTLGVASSDQVLEAGDHGVLLTPADIARFRMNIGVRTGPSGASMTVTRRNAAGTILQTLAKSYPPTFFEQISGAEFLAGTPFGASDSITIQVTAGSAIVYGITADNTTQDPSIQFATRLP